MTVTSGSKGEINRNFNTISEMRELHLSLESSRYSSTAMHIEYQ